WKAIQSFRLRLHSGLRQSGNALCARRLTAHLKMGPSVLWLRSKSEGPRAFLARLNARYPILLPEGGAPGRCWLYAAADVAVGGRDFEADGDVAGFGFGEGDEEGVGGLFESEWGG